MSPLFSSKALARTIDLSQLSEVVDAFYVEHTDGEDDIYLVGFHYRIGGGELTKFQRELRQGPTRIGTKMEHHLKDPSQELLTLCEEMYEVRHPTVHQSWDNCIVILRSSDGQPVALKSMQQVIDELKAAWLAWKMR